MKKSKCTGKQIAFALRQAEVGTPDRALNRTTLWERNCRVPRASCRGGPIADLRHRLSGSAARAPRGIRHVATPEVTDSSAIFPMKDVIDRLVPVFAGGNAVGAAHFG